MRIVFMHRQLAGGGTEADLTRVATLLAARGHDMHVVCAKENAVVPGATVHRIPIVRAGRAARVLSFALAAPRAAERLRPDVVVGYGRAIRQDVARIGGGTHRSYLRTMRDAGGRLRGLGPYHRAILWVEARQFAPTGQRAILAVAEQVRRQIQQDYGVDGDAIHVIYNGVDGERFHPRSRGLLGADTRRALGLGPTERLCLAIGSGFERKGFDLLSRLWGTTAPAGLRLALVGADERLGAYRRAAATGAGRVLVLGPRDDVPALLAAADVLCVPSRQEAFGNVVLEGCAAAVPVVTSVRVGAAELLTGDLRELVVSDPQDATSLRRAIELAVGPDHDRYARAGRALAEERPWSRHVAEVEGLLEAVARG